MTEIPTIALGDVVIDAQSGFASGDDLADGLFQVRMNNVTREGSWDLSKMRRVKPGFRLDRYLLEAGDVLVNTTNSPELVGKTALFVGLDEPAAYSNHFTRLRLRQDVADPSYVTHWLQYAFRQGTLRSLAKQWVNQATINRDRLLAMPLPLPDPTEQRRIADILERAAELARASSAAVRVADAIVDARLSVLLDEVAGPVCSLREMSSLITKGTTPTSVGLTFDEGGPVPFLRVGDLVGRTVDADAVALAIGREAHAALARSKVQGGDLLVSIAGTIGRVSAVPANAPEMNCNQAVAIVRLKANVSRHYVQAWLESKDATRQMGLTSVTGTIANLSLTQLGNLQLPSPTVSQQTAFDRDIEELSGLHQILRFREGQVGELAVSTQRRAFRGEL